MQSWCPSLPKWVCESTVYGSSACMITYSIALQGREGGVRAALLEVTAAPWDGISTLYIEDVNVSCTRFHNDFTTSPLLLMVDWMENIWKHHESPLTCYDCRDFACLNMVELPGHHERLSAAHMCALSNQYRTKIGKWWKMTKLAKTSKTSMQRKTSNSHIQV